MGQYQLQTELKPWHEAVVDWMLANPTGTLEQCAVHFGKSYGWLGQLVHTDAFQEYKALRFKAHHDRVSETIVNRTVGVLEDTLDTMQFRIQQERDRISLDFLHNTAELLYQTLGYGPKAQRAEPHVVTLNFGGAPRDVLEQARSDMRQVHQRNTREVEDAEVADDAGDAPKSLTAQAMDEAE